MTTRPHSSFKIVFILGLLAMLMPLSIDMYLPALPVISAQFGVPAGSAQMTLSTYILGFALGQLFYGPMADSLGRLPEGRVLTHDVVRHAGHDNCAAGRPHGGRGGPGVVQLACDFLDPGDCRAAGLGDDLRLYR